MPFTETFQDLPESLHNLVRHGVNLTSPARVILFGSRARGDFSSTSDYDIAFSQLKHPTGWPQFLVDFDEKPLTLLKVDLVIYEQVTNEYRKNIDKDGVLLYEF